MAKMRVGGMLEAVRVQLLGGYSTVDKIVGV